MLPRSCLNPLQVLSTILVPPLQHGHSLEAQHANHMAPASLIHGEKALPPPETRPLVETEQAEHAAELCRHGTLVWGEIIIKVDFLATESLKLLQELVILLNSPKFNTHRPWPDLLASLSLCWWLAQIDSLAVCEWLKAPRLAYCLDPYPEHKSLVLHKARAHNQGTRDVLELNRRAAKRGGHRANASIGAVFVAACTNGCASY